MKKNREVVHAACRNYAEAFQYASDDVRRDREFVLALVCDCGLALKYADSKLLADKEIILAAVASHGGALKLAADDLRNDAAFVTLCAERNPASIRGASIDLMESEDRADEWAAVLVVAGNARKKKQALLQVNAAAEDTEKSIDDADVETDGDAQEDISIVKDSHWAAENEEEQENIVDSEVEGGSDLEDDNDGPD